MEPTVRILSDQVRSYALILALCAGFLHIPTHISAQAQLVRDLNRLESSFDIEYDDLTKANNTVFFTNLGKELWNTDGTNPGGKRFRILDSLTELTWTGTALFFAGKDSRGWELWVSNGPSTATKRIKDIYPGAQGCNPKELTNINGVVYFVAEDARYGRELWKSDGTSAGTVLVKDIYPAAGSSNPSHLANINGVLYFSAEDGTHGRELWRSNGTVAGTVMLKDIIPGQAGSEPQSFTYLNGNAYFTASTEQTGRELWRTNGTASGTVITKDIKPGPASSLIASIVVMNNALYFTAEAAVGKYALWKSSGSTAGTTKVVDVTSNESDVFFLKALNSNLYFLANSGGDDDYLWRSDGTAGGTRKVQVMSRATHPAFTYFNNRIYFFEYYWDPEIYSALIKLNKMSPEGTDVSTIWKMNYGWSIDGRKLFDSPLINIDNSLVFFGIPKDGQGFKILKMDGGSEEVSAVKDTFIPTFSSNPDQLVTANGVVYLRSMGITNYENLYRTDGTTAGTFPLKRSEYIQGIGALGGNAYFTAFTDSRKWQLWKTDGTKAGNTLIKESTFNGSLPVEVNGLFYFINAAEEVWKTDGTAAGTVRIKQFANMIDIFASGDRCYLYITSGDGFQELWKTDGTGPGTVRVKRVQMNRAPYYTSPITVNNIFYFVGNDGRHGNELWRSDGTTDGTYMVKDLRANDLDANDFYSLTGFKNEVYFSAVESGNQYALYRSNGTAEGTVKIKNTDAIFHYIPYGDQLLFFPGQQEPPAIWTTDGTPEGTRAFKTLDGEERFYEVHAALVGDVLYFTTGENCCNEESVGNLWRTDGTECGTFLIPTGLRNVSPVHYFGGNLLIGGYGSYLYGKELYRYNLANAPESPCLQVLPEISRVSNTLSSENAGMNTPYPNPFTGDFSIRFAEGDSVQMEVLTSSGLPIERLRNLSSMADHTFGRTWPIGTYILRIKTPDREWAVRVIKRR